MNTSKFYFALLILLINYSNSIFATTDKYRLMFNGNPSMEVTLGFDSYSINNNPIVYYSTSPININNLSIYMSKTPDKKIDAFGMINCFVELNNLTPNQQYYFVVKDYNSVSEIYNFETISDSNNTQLSILAGSDSRNNFEVRKNANKIVSKLNAHALLFGGDMTNNGSNEEWERWLNDWQLSISENNRITPLIVCRGNHENSNAMIAQLFDTSAEVYYANTLGGNLLRTYTLNSETALFGDQTDWLEEDFNNNQGVIWKFVQYHTPMRPHVASKTEGSNQYARWANLFYQNSVDIVMEGDAHTVKTTWPVVPCSGGFNCHQGFKRNDDAGITFIGEGTYASPLRPNDDIKPWTRDSGIFYQFKWLIINKSKIEIRTIVYDDVTDTDEIASLTQTNRFTIPQNLDIWNPSNGSVITLNGPALNEPQCNIIKPAENSMHENFDNISLSAEAYSSVNLAQLEMYINGSLYHTFTSPNTPNTQNTYNMNWQPVTEGTYFISVIAKDVNGLSSPMHTSVITVGPRDNVLRTARININANEYYEKLVNGFIYQNAWKHKVCSNSKFLQGLRFTAINLPPNAIIESAHILFETKGGNGNADAEIWTENNANGQVFLANPYNISQRIKSNNSVVWDSIPNWYGTPTIADRTTPDLSNLVQELVNLPDWTIESPIVFLIKGNGTRDAKSYYSMDVTQNPHGIGPPILSVQFSLPECASCITIGNSDLPENSYQTRDCVISNKIIPSNAQYVEYSATGSVQLNSGFSVSPNTNFRITNTGCY